MNRSEERDDTATYTTAMILRRRWHRLAIAAAVLSAAAGVAALEAPPSASESRVSIVLSRGNEHYRARIALAARESIGQLERWLGARLRSPLTISDAAAPVTGGRDAIIPVRLPAYAAPELMEIEMQVAYGVARRYWHAGAEASRANLADGLSWYLQSRIVEHLFNIGFSRPAHSADGIRLFGGHVSWAFPSLLSSRASRGVGRNVFLRGHASGDVGGPAPFEPRLAPGITAATVRSALAFATLERLIGWPVLQSALSELAREPDVPLTASRVGGVVSAVAGRDLAWFFEAAFDSAIRIDYGIESFESVPAGGCATTPCFHARVDIVRKGDGRFTGTSQPPLGPYDAGDGIRLLVTFEGGQRASATWDGRAERRRVEFETSAAIASAHLNPDGTLLLDPTPFDHARYATPQSNVPILKWAARWAVWLQHAMLTVAMPF